MDAWRAAHTDRREAEHDVQMTSHSRVVVAVQVLVRRRPARKLLLHHRHQFFEYFVHLVASEQVRHLRVRTPSVNSVVIGDRRPAPHLPCVPRTARSNRR